MSSEVVSNHILVISQTSGTINTLHSLVNEKFAFICYISSASDRISLIEIPSKFIYGIIFTVSFSIQLNMLMEMKVISNDGLDGVSS
jgi:hypothetical protein